MSDRPAEERLGEVVKVLRDLDPGGCREWIDDKVNYCFEPSEFVLWGKLFPPEALGPRCYEHAAKHTGHQMLGTDAAIIDLRPLRFALAVPPEAAA